MKQIDDITWQSNDGLITFKNMDCNDFMHSKKNINNKYIRTYEQYKNIEE